MNAAPRKSKPVSVILNREEMNLETLYSGDYLIEMGEREEYVTPNLLWNRHVRDLPHKPRKTPHRPTGSNQILRGPLPNKPIQLPWR